MKKEFMRTARKSYMVVHDADYRYEKYEVQMILRNHIPALLDMQMILENEEARYWYDVTGMQSLEKQYMLEPLSEQQLRKLFTGIMDVKLQLDEYLLKDENLLFDTDMIFFDRNADRFRFCYVPGYDQNGDSGMEELMETILQKLDHSDSTAVRMGYDMYERIMKNGFLLEDCRECLGGNSDLQVEPARPLQEPTPMEAFAEAMHLESEPEDLSTKRKSKNRKNRREKKAEPREELQQEYFREPLPQPACIAESRPQWNPTEMFEREPLQQAWVLTYQGNGLEQDLRMTRFPYLIGKDAAKVDGALCARTVSRIHARIAEQEGRLYLEDYNSTNGTYHNGKMLPMNTPCPLQEGDQLVFATEEFRLERKPVPNNSQIVH